MRMKKCWWPLFSWLLNVSVQNAWLVYPRIAEEQDLDRLNFLVFTRRITLYYLARAEVVSNEVVLLK